MYKQPWLNAVVAADTTIYSAAFNLDHCTLVGAQVKFTQPRVLAIAALLAVQDLTYTAKAAGAAGNAITITYIDPAGNNAALSVAVTGTDIVVTLATDGSSTPTSTATQVKAAIEAKAEAAALVSIAVTGTATTVQAAEAETPLATGADETDGAIDGKVYLQVSCEDIMQRKDVEPSEWSDFDSGTAVTASAAGNVFHDAVDVAPRWARLKFVPAVGGSDVTYFTAHVQLK